MDDEIKAVKIMLAAGALLAGYWWLRKSGTWDRWFAPAEVAAAPQTAPNLRIPGCTPVAPAGSFVPEAYAKAAFALQANAGTNSLRLDQWGEYWETAVAYPGAPLGFGTRGSIGPRTLAEMRVALGVDPAALVSAPTFVAALYRSQVTDAMAFETAGEGAHAGPYKWVN